VKILQKVLWGVLFGLTLYMVETILITDVEIQLMTHHLCVTYFFLVSSVETISVATI